uniref:Uncharacterized protein n=1 Tax=Physcomitrium patens TaxID=3218 RepID=A0A2K1KF59_PHYPA|nr:hypothetical protein PHYPA_008787 [Physcomitrium patens]
MVSRRDTIRSYWSTLYRGLHAIDSGPRQKLIHSIVRSIPEMADRQDPFPKAPPPSRRPSVVDLGQYVTE